MTEYGVFSQCESLSLAAYVAQVKKLFVTSCEGDRDRDSKTQGVYGGVSSKKKRVSWQGVIGNLVDRGVIKTIQGIDDDISDKETLRKVVDALFPAGVGTLPFDDATIANYFPPPYLPAITRERSLFQIDDGDVFDLRFASYYAPQRESAIEFLRRYPENATVYVRHFCHGDAHRPALICLHGRQTGQPHLDAAIFRARFFFQQGFDVYLYVQPYHGLRGSSSVERVPHPSGNIERTNEAMFQSVWEVRALLRYHREQYRGGVGLIGISLGSYVASLVASLERDLSFVIAMLPIADLSAVFWSLGARTSMRQEATVQDITFEDLCSAMAIHAPLAHRLKIPTEKTLIVSGESDRIATPTHALALSHHWGNAKLHWFPGGHLAHFGRNAYFQMIEQWLRHQRVI